MLAVLPHGVCVDPETVKILSIRAEQGKGPDKKGMLFVVTMKTDADDQWIVVAAFDDRGEAEKLTQECSRRINKALGAETEDEGAKGGDDAPPAKSAAKAKPADDDDW